MSLKSFHLFFIAAATLLAGGFAGWAINQYSYSHETRLLVMGIASLVVAAALVVYLPWFLRKYRDLSFLAIAALIAAGLSAPRSAWACAVCVGNPASPMVKSANAGILFLLVVIGSVLTGFVGLFAFWWLRTRALKHQQNTPGSSYRILGTI